MTAKRKKLDIDPKTAIYILIVVLIIVGVAYFVLNSSDESEDVLSVREVNLNKDKYIDKNIKVEGIYYSEGDSLISAFTTIANPNPEDQLDLNLENIDNETLANLTNNEKYIIEGKLTKVSEYQGAMIVELVVTDIKFV